MSKEELDGDSVDDDVKWIICTSFFMAHQLNLPNLLVPKAAFDSSFSTLGSVVGWTFALEGTEDVADPNYPRMTFKSLVYIFMEKFIRSGKALIIQETGLEAGNPVTESGYKAEFTDEDLSFTLVLFKAMAEVLDTDNKKYEGMAEDDRGKS